ncbi:hypothetical protein EYF80_027360 [Liparis tanakae]|uniref:Secreted protein n=1 Tax=Liparis tanakae TaxID=230148 RepID=A0A4Z2HCF1_9TELE|nr:hypothetical protein EYF80_027360 [Liparis tanakae]
MLFCRFLSRIFWSSFFSLQAQGLKNTRRQTPTCQRGTVPTYGSATLMGAVREGARTFKISGEGHGGNPRVSPWRVQLLPELQQLLHLPLPELHRLLLQLLVQGRQLALHRLLGLAEHTQGAQAKSPKSSNKIL